MKHVTSRRTTLTLPSEYLETAEQIAVERHLSLSSVIAEALQSGLQEEQQAQRSEAILQAYSKAFQDFTAEELLLLDGVLIGEQTTEQVTPIGKPSGKVKKRARNDQSGLGTFPL